MANEVTASGIGAKRVPKACCEIISDKFDMGSDVPLESAQLNGTTGFVRPVGGIAAGSPYTFELTPIADSFLMMNGIYIYGKCQVVGGNDAAIAAAAKVGLVNGFGLSIFDEISVFLNGFKISQDTDTNVHYKSMIETLLSYENEAMNTHLKTTLYDLDKPANLENFDPTAAGNDAFKGRAKFIKESRTFDFAVPLATDFTRADNHLAPGNTLLIKAKLNNNRFLIKSSEDNASYKLVIKDLKMYYHRVRLDPSITSKILGKTHRYLTAKTQLLHRSLASGLSNYNTQLFQGLLPRTLVISMVRTDAFNGSYSKNPYNFQHFDINTINLRVNGIAVPADSYMPDFENDIYMREYLELFRNTGTYRVDRGTAISYERFKKGCTFFAFDLTPDLCNSNHLHVSTPGVLSAEFNFKNALPTNITILFYAVFSQRITTDADIKLQSAIDIL